MAYFSCKVTVEDAEAFKPGQAYVVGIATVHRNTCCCIAMNPAIQTIHTDNTCTACYILNSTSNKLMLCQLQHRGVSKQ